MGGWNEVFIRRYAQRCSVDQGWVCCVADMGFIILSITGSPSFPEEILERCCLVERRGMRRGMRREMRRQLGFFGAGQWNNGGLDMRW